MTLYKGLFRLIYQIVQRLQYFLVESFLWKKNGNIGLISGPFVNPNPHGITLQKI